MLEAKKEEIGIVDVDGQKKTVQYHFIDCQTIRCTDQKGNEFDTHYKSLVVGD